MIASGFTKTIFYLNGQIIPRDARSRLMKELIDVDKKTWEKLQSVIFLFFVKKKPWRKKERTRSPRSMWNRNGRVYPFQEASEKSPALILKTQNYDEYEFIATFRDPNES